MATFMCMSWDYPIRTTKFYQRIKEFLCDLWMEGPFYEGIRKTFKLFSRDFAKAALVAVVWTQLRFGIFALKAAQLAKSSKSFSFHPLLVAVIDVPLQCQFPSKSTSFKHQMASEDAQGTSMAFDARCEFF